MTRFMLNIHYCNTLTPAIHNYTVYLFIFEKKKVNLSLLLDYKNKSGTEYISKQSHHKILRV